MARSELLETAIDAARAGEHVIRHYYLDDVAVKLKSDRTPVTVADVETEEAIRAVLRERFPEHGFYGEETGRDGGESDYLWLIDPIDGTKSFVREYPFFSTQIALMHRGELVLGVSNAPLFSELAWAERGRGAWLNDAPVHVSAIDRLDEATLSLGNVRSAAGSELWSRIGALVRVLNRTRGYGDFYHYHLLAAGKLEIVLESDLNILDIAALTVIVREAGGIVTDLEGRDVDLETTSILATNAAIRDGVLELLRG
ncbi:MAG TPA: inositol monophosphatase family protein [Gammaproteobacteria bacterium]|nr:inositol monophosphatase family protein [Gammaproteobacteria bacterium]